MAFNLDEMLAGMKRDASAREQIEYISVDLIVPDKKNFYKLSNLDELVASIELVGLQQPIRVRPMEGDDSQVVIVSGHRRHAAICRLVEEGHEEFRDVPCIVEEDVVSPEMQQLRLIYANSTTRVLTSAELSRQAVEVEELLYKLKEQGVEFTGRMRDHVAKAVNASKSKLARLKVIRDGLAPDLKGEWEHGRLNDEVALALAKLDTGDQLRIYKSAHCSSYMSKSAIDDCVRGFEQVRGYACKKTGGKCAHIGHMEQRILDSGRWSTAECLRSHCCLKCDHLRDCGSPCTHAVEKKVALREQRRAEQKTAREKQLAEDAVKIAFITGVYSRIQQRRQEVGVSLQQLLSHMNMYSNASSEAEFARYAAGEKVRPTTSLPFSYGANEAEYRRLVDAADVLQCSTDYLLGHQAPEPKLEGGWYTGNPKSPTWAICRIADGEYPDAVQYLRCWWGGKTWKNVEQPYTVTHWIPEPEET